MTFTGEQAERYRKRIRASVSADDNGCWIWTKTRSRNGYGSFAFGGGHNGRAHRVSYQVFVGDVPDGHDVCHRCDVRACVNPAHLFTGTRSENILDAVKKNRVDRLNKARGEAHPCAKLNDKKVAEILMRLANGETKNALAHEFDVTHRVITLIERGEAWAHIPRNTPSVNILDAG